MEDGYCGGCSILHGLILVSDACPLDACCGTGNPILHGLISDWSDSCPLGDWCGIGIPILHGLISVIRFMSIGWFVLHENKNKMTLKNEIRKINKNK